MEQNLSTDSLAQDQTQREGRFTKALEKQTAKVPSGVYLGLAVGSVLLSAGLAMSEKRKGWANFVGLWVPTILLLGVYNKIVKIEGSDKMEKSQILH
ncbi:MAG TPA: hypothetical protein VIG33_03795 [Pseudobdellovibrionaceae bacterium]|jgi:hypothetical protein